MYQILFIAYMIGCALFKLGMDAVFKAMAEGDSSRCVVLGAGLFMLVALLVALPVIMVLKERGQI